MHIGESKIAADMIVRETCVAAATDIERPLSFVREIDQPLVELLRQVWPLPLNGFRSEIITPDPPRGRMGAIAPSDGNFSVQTFVTPGRNGESVVWPCRSPMNLFS